MHISFIVIPLITIMVAIIGSRFTARSVKTWYATLKKPSWTPRGSTIGAVWTILYILATTSALIVWNLPARHGGLFWFVVGVFIANAILNVLWSYIFFARRTMGVAIWVCLLLDLTVIVLVQSISSFSLLAAWLLVPYEAWATFAAYLNYRIWTMNKAKVF